MKSVLIALLLIAVLVFVAAEAKRKRGKGKPGGKKQWLKKVKGEFCSRVSFLFELEIGLMS